MRAIVVGGSLAGLFAANLLRELGWQVDVIERTAGALASRGAGIGTHEELFEVLRRVGIGIDAGAGIRVDDRICLDRAGAVVHRIPWGHVMSAWGRIYRPLKDRVPANRYHSGRGVVRWAAGDGGIAVACEDGTQAEADLLIGADGVRSAVRAQLYPGAAPVYAGYVAWRGVIEERAMPAELRDRLETAYYFGLPPGEMMLCYPVPGRDPAARAGRDWNYVWYRPTGGPQGLRDLCTDASGHHHGTAIPPPLVRPELTAAVKRAAHVLLAPQIARIVELSQPFFQAIFDLETPCIGRDRVALVGDAAFVARPHVGMGVTKAALDALCLARSIDLERGDLDAALARYDRLRGEFGRRCVARGRRIGAFIEARAGTGPGASAAHLDQSPERILREVGARLSDIPELNLPV